MVTFSIVTSYDYYTNKFHRKEIGVDLIRYKKEKTLSAMDELYLQNGTFSNYFCFFFFAPLSLQFLSPFISIDVIILQGVDKRKGRYFVRILSDRGCDLMEYMNLNAPKNQMSPFLPPKLHLNM
jgi:hypothetical protein